MLLRVSMSFVECMSIMLAVPSSKFHRAHKCYRSGYVQGFSILSETES